MSNNQDWYEEDEFDGMDDSSTGDDLVKKLRRAERAKDKRVRELEAELESLRKAQREATVSKVLSEKGINPKIAALIPATVDMTPEGLDSWLEEFGDVFGVVKSEQEKVNREDLDALRQIDAATSNALSPDDVNDAFSKINNAQSAEDILNMFNG